jgi:hypothetical protein
MMDVPAEEHIHFSKMDLTNGYWQMLVKPVAHWNFAYAMPSPPGTPTRLVIPRALQMGWNESPAYFCATTESIRDVAQSWLVAGTHKPVQLMESFTAPTKPARPQSLVGPAHQMSAVYVDDFLLAAVQDATGKFLQRMARGTLHAIHSVFPTPKATGTIDTKDPISEKKLAKGDARWATLKEILGYWLDGIYHIVQLLPLRADNLRLKRLLLFYERKGSLLNGSAP